MRVHKPTKKSLVWISVLIVCAVIFLAYLVSVLNLTTDARRGDEAHDYLCARRASIPARIVGNDSFIGSAKGLISPPVYQIIKAYLENENVNLLLEYQALSTMHC